MFGLFGYASIVFTVVHPVAYVNIDAVAGLFDGNGESMALAADEGKLFLHVEVAPVYRYGKEIVV